MWEILILFGKIVGGIVTVAIVFCLLEGKTEYIQTREHSKKRCLFKREP